MSEDKGLLPSSISSQLNLSNWNTLSEDQQLTLVESLTIHLNERGYDLRNPRLEHHGPAATQTVAVWRDDSRGLDFALIPGGEFRPGYSETQLETYKHLFQVINQANVDALKSQGHEDPESDLDDVFEPPDKVRLFASRATCDMRSKPPATIAPFLMCTTLVPATMPGLHTVVELPTWQSWEDLETNQLPIHLRWPMVEPVLKHCRWTLPTSEEFEWALQGGVAGLFYWGDKLPMSIFDHLVFCENPQQHIPQAEIASTVTFEDLMTRELDPAHPHVWPYYNRFGLASMLACGTWCMPNADPEDPFPLKLRGGAANCYPWQNCGEWKLLFSAAEWRIGHATDYADWNGLRPIIRLWSEL